MGWALELQPLAAVHGDGLIWGEIDPTDPPLSTDNNAMQFYAGRLSGESTMPPRPVDIVVYTGELHNSERYLIPPFMGQPRLP